MNVDVAFMSTLVALLPCFKGKFCIQHFTKLAYKVGRDRILIESYFCL